MVRRIDERIFRLVVLEQPVTGARVWITFLQSGSCPGGLKQGYLRELIADVADCYNERLFLVSFNLVRPHSIEDALKFNDPFPIAAIYFDVVRKPLAIRRHGHTFGEFAAVGDPCFQIERCLFPVSEREANICFDEFVTAGCENPTARVGNHTALVAIGIDKQVAVVGGHNLDIPGFQQSLHRPGMSQRLAMLPLLSVIGVFPVAPLRVAKWTIFRVRTGVGRFLFTLGFADTFKLFGRISTRRCVKLPASDEWRWVSKCNDALEEQNAQQTITAQYLAIRSGGAIIQRRPLFIDSVGIRAGHERELSCYHQSGWNSIAVAAVNTLTDHRCWLSYEISDTSRCSSGDPRS